MKNNVGGLDKKLRIIFAIIVVALYATGTIGGTLAIILSVIGVVMFVTALMGFCPLYKIIGFSSCGSCCGSKENCDTEEK